VKAMACAELGRIVSVEWVRGAEMDSLTPMRMKNLCLCLFALVFLIAFALASSGDEKVYFINNTPVIPGNNSLYRYDLSTKKVSRISDTLNGLQAYLSSAVVCDGAFYGATSHAPISFGIGKVNLTTGESVAAGSVALYHAIACGPAGSNLLYGIASLPTASGLQFTVRHFNTQTFTDTQVAIIPTKKLFWKGSDAAISINAQLGEAWFADDVEGDGGRLLVIDMHNGTVKGDYLLSFLAGSAYGVILGAASGRGAVIEQRDDGFHWYGATIEGERAHLSHDLPANWFFHAGVPPAISAERTTGCLASDSGSRTLQNLNIFSVTEGKVIESIPLQNLVQENYVSVAAVAFGH
jgi:hypothetical protein